MLEMQTSAAVRQSRAVARRVGTSLLATPRCPTSPPLLLLLLLLQVFLPLYSLGWSYMKKLITETSAPGRSEHLTSASSPSSSLAQRLNRVLLSYYYYRRQHVYSDLLNSTPGLLSHHHRQPRCKDKTPADTYEPLLRRDCRNSSVAQPPQPSGGRHPTPTSWALATSPAPSKAPGWA